jgi:hypothetical protein
MGDFPHCRPGAAGYSRQGALPAALQDVRRILPREVAVNVGQTRELARVKTAKMKRKIWAALISSKENPTAQCIRRAVVEFLPPKTARRKKVTLPVVFPASAIVDICEDMRLAVKSGDLRKLSAQINAMRNIIKSHQADLKAAP